MTSSQPDPRDHHPGLLLHDCYRLLRQLLRARFADVGLSEARWRVLSTVNRLPGISQTSLANQLGIAKAPLGHLVDRLEAEALLERRIDTRDRRVKCLHVTREATPIIRALRSRYLTAEREFLAGISTGERQQLQGTFAQLYAFLSEQDPRGKAVPAENLPLMMALAGVNRVSGRLFDAQLRTIGFTRSQWLVLDTISRREGLRQSELGQHLTIKKAPLGTLIDDLEAGNWVERRVHPQDRRARQLFLTKACRSRMHSLVQAYEKLHNRAMQGIDGAQQKQLRQSLTTLRRNLRAMASEPHSPTPEINP